MARARSALPLWHPAALISTWFGAGLLPKAPGTWGSLAALPFAWLIKSFGGTYFLLAGAIVIFMVGWWAAARYKQALDARGGGAKDPAEIVVDEVSGQWLALVIADPGVWWHWLIGFILFRAFDIAKPWPASALDRRTDAFGVMADDTAAGVYALILLALGIFVQNMINGR